MSVVGIDIGNAFCVVAAAGKGGVDVVLNEESKRETPACVAIGERQRFLGAAAASPAPATTAVSQIKRLIGRPYDDALKSELRALFPTLQVSGDAEGYPLIHFKYRDGEVSLSPTQLLGMLLGGLKRSAERHLGVPVNDCCIAVPAHFNDVQRRAVLHAAEIAGLRPLRLLHECSAAVLEYGIYRRDFPVDPRARAHVAAIVDVGHSATQVAVAEFRAGGARILARASDPNLGGRDFDGALFHHFAAKLVADDPDLDVNKNVRAPARLRASCEKVKKVLSANPEATLHIECFMEDKDASGLITREEFERTCHPLLVRLRLPLQKALSEAGLKPEDIEAVELIGSGSRVPSVVKVVGEVFQQEPRRTLNASECVARGCALQAAMLSPAFQVKTFKIHDNAPFAIHVAWKNIIAKLPSGTAEEPHRYPILNKGDQIPCRKTFAFDRKENTFSFDLVCAENPIAAKFSTYDVGPFRLTQNGTTQLKIAFKLSLDGIISVDSVTVLSGEDESSRSFQGTSEDDSRMDIDDTMPSDPMQSDLCAENPETPHEASNTCDSARTEESEHPSYNDAAKMNRKSLGCHFAEEKEEKKTVVKFSEHLYGAFSLERLEEAKKMETKMAFWDREVEETKDRKNALESYVYEMRNKLRGKYQEFVTEAERQLLVDKFNEIEKWLYDEGEDVACNTYISKLDELKMLCDPIEKRFHESSERGAAVQRLLCCIEQFRSQCSRSQYDHIDENEKWRIRAYCGDIETWLYQRIESQNMCSKHEDPILTIGELCQVTGDLTRFCEMILSKPAPTPPKTMGIADGIADWWFGRPQKQPQPHRDEGEMHRPGGPARRPRENWDKARQLSLGRHGGANQQKQLEEESQAETGRPPHGPGKQPQLHGENGEETMPTRQPPLAPPQLLQRAEYDEANPHSETYQGSQPVGEPLVMCCKAKDYAKGMYQSAASSNPDHRDNLDMRSLAEECHWVQQMAYDKPPHQDAGHYDGKAYNKPPHQGYPPSGELEKQSRSGYGWPSEYQVYTMPEQCYNPQIQAPCHHSSQIGGQAPPTNHDRTPNTMPHVSSNRFTPPLAGSQGAGYSQLTQKVEDEELSYIQLQPMEATRGNSQEQRRHQLGREANPCNPGHQHGSLGKKNRLKGASTASFILDKISDTVQGKKGHRSSPHNDTSNGSRTATKGKHSTSRSEGNMQNIIERGNVETSRSKKNREAWKT